MSLHEEWSLSGHLRRKKAVVLQAHRLRNEALWSAPGVLWRAGARALGAIRRWWDRAPARRA